MATQSTHRDWQDQNLILIDVKLLIVTQRDKKFTASKGGGLVNEVTLIYGHITEFQHSS